jgi:hypothetical protein
MNYRTSPQAQVEIMHALATLSSSIWKVQGRVGQWLAVIYHKSRVFLHSCVPAFLAYIRGSIDLPIAQRLQGRRSFHSVGYLGAGAKT